MPTESEIKIARYNQIEKEADELGRIIGVRRLKPSEQTKLIGLTAELTGSDPVMLTDEEGKDRVVHVPHRQPLTVAASVCLIVDEMGEARIPFPKTRGELDAIFDRLDVEGLIAAGKGIERLSQTGRTGGDPKADAKNL